MIIGLRSKCNIGEIVEGDYTYTEDNIIRATFLILRDSSYEEWQAYRESEGRPITKEHPKGYYYEVHTD